MLLRLAALVAARAAAEDMQSFTFNPPGDDAPLPPLDRCDACFVVWESLGGVLALESRMDKDRSDTNTGGGARAAYATSEVRRERLLGRVCTYVNAYRYNDQGAYWVKNATVISEYFAQGKMAPRLGVVRNPRSQLMRDLEGYCARAIEDREDELWAAITVGVDDNGRAIFCARDCSDFAEAAKRQGIARLLASIGTEDEPKQARPKRRKRKKKKKAEEL
mmetsp:Transcript_21627/g.64749  ORF Transcript_21627/g.64749 Transcript_21627/m.64749 type:complete len:220 (+) Transcript_21627:176-835(+)